MKRRLGRSVAVAAAGVIVMGCADQEARDAADEAQARADAAYAVSDEERLRVDGIERRLERLEQYR